MKSVYLGDKGLTSSEANHITNITKEIVKEFDSKIEGFAISNSIAIRQGTELILSEYKRIDFKELVLKRGELYSLSAWLKSGIKRKEELSSSVGNGNTGYGDLVPPVKSTLPNAPSTTFESYLETCTVREVAEYLSAESSAAHVGKFVHNFDSVREMLNKFSPTGFHTIGGNEVLTVKNTLIYTENELIGGFFDLQKEYREFEKVVNLFKSRHKDWVKSILDTYSDEVSLITKNNAEVDSKYRNELYQVELEFEKQKREDLKTVSNLKIIIPSDLQATLDFVNEYAKK